MHSPTLPRRMGLVLSCLTLLCFAGGCLPEFEVPAGALIDCRTNADCPSGMICRAATGRCSPLTDDLEPPALSYSGVEIGPFGRGGEVVATAFIEEPLPYPPRVWIAAGPYRREMAFDADLSGEGFYYFRYLVQDDDPAGSHEVLADLVDAAGNLAASVRLGTTLFDFSPPEYFEGTAGLRVTPAAGLNPLDAGEVRFLTWGSTVTVWFTLTEPASEISLRAQAEGFALDFELVSESQDQLGFLFEATLEPDPGAPERDRADLSFVVDAVDLAGNATDPSLVLPLTLVLDTQPPAPPVQSAGADGPRVIYRRSPGTSAGSEARFTVRATAGAIPSNSTVIVLDGPSPLSASELGRGRVIDGVLPELELRRIDLPEVFVLVADPAGNVSDEVPDDSTLPGLAGDVQASRVRHVEYLVPAPGFSGTSAAARVRTTGVLLASREQDPASTWTPPEAALCLAEVEGLESRTLIRAGEARWTSRPATDWPQSRSGAAAAWDSRRGRLVLFGGVSADGDPLRDTWEFDPETGAWTDRDPAGPRPTARFGHAMAFDERRGKVLLFGGFDAVVDDEDEAVWEWDGEAGSWLRRAPVGPGPHFRSGHSLLFDGPRARLLLFGGDQRFPEATRYSGESWSWDPGSGRWSLLSQTGPSPRAGAASSRTPSGGWLVAGGYGERASGGRGLLDDTWLFDPATDAWTLSGAGGIPACRGAVAALVDTPDSGPAVLLSGGEAADSTVCADAWRFEGGAWLALPAGSVPATAGGLFVATAGGEALIFGGRPAGGPSSPTANLWRYSHGFTRVGPGPGRPGPRAFAGFAMDGVRALLFGGERAGEPLGDGWTLDAGGVWTQLPAAGAPAARTGPALAWDAERGQAVLFGGRGTADLLADTWIWDGAWRQAAPVHSPVARERAAIAWDPARRRVVLFGGRAAAGWLSDLWEWDGANWTQRSPSGAWPGARESAGLAPDADRGTLVLFGGLRREGQSVLLDADVWEWDGSAGTFARRGPGPAPAGQTALGRAGASLAWDALRRKVLLFGGDQNAPLDDLWEWDGSSATWLARTPPGRSPRARHGQAAAWDQARGRLVVFGGNDGRQELDDLWELDAGAQARPALLWSAPFPSVVSEPQLIGATLRATVGGRAGNALGAELLLWDTAAGRWASLGENDAPTWPAGPLVLELAPEQLAGALPQATGALDLAIVPRAPSGSALLPAEAGADHLELKLRYLLPRGAP